MRDQIEIVYKDRHFRVLVGVGGRSATIRSNEMTSEERLTPIFYRCWPVARPENVRRIGAIIANQIKNRDAYLIMKS